VLDAQGHAQTLFRLEINDDTDHFVLTVPSGGVLRLETLSWTGSGCSGDTVMTLNPENGGPTDDDGGQNRCSLLSIESDAMTVRPGDQAIEVTGYSGGVTGYNWLIVDFVPMEIGSDCEVGGIIPCPEGSYCAADTTECTAHVCGDGVLNEAEEACDDGNEVDGDGCEACQFGPVPEGGACVLVGLPSCADGLACHPTDLLCVVPVCGDGFQHGDEPCDDGDMDNTNGCNEACELSPFNGAAEPDALDAPYLVPIVDNQGAVLFELDTPDDVDFFAFDLAERAHVRISNAAYPAGGCDVALFATLYQADGDAVGTAPDSCAALDTEDPAQGFGGSLQPGRYVVEVLDLDGFERPAHWLNIAVSPDRLRACEDTLDNDEDGVVDAADPGCGHARDDNEVDPAEVAECSDGADNDEDGLIDYPNDPECTFAGHAFEGIICPGFEDVAVHVGPEGALVEVITAGRPNLLEASCASSSRGGEVPIIVTLDAPAQITVETVGADYDTSIHTRTSCAPDGMELECDDDGGAGTLSRIHTLREAGQHYFFIDGYAQSSGTAQVQITVAPDAP
jgi:cysteine-rich repeat protein